MINPLKRVEINHFTFTHPTIPPALNGYTFVQISDVHMGRWVKAGHMSNLVGLVNEMRPDAAVLTGDYVGYSKSDIARCVQTLDELQVPTYAVLGNHDHWTSTELCTQEFEASSIHLLTNEHMIIDHGDDHFYMVGVDDHVTGHADASAAFEGIPDDRFCLTLNHVPSYAPECAKRGGHLILGGHTHNYQFNVPGLTNRLVTRLGGEFFAGPYRFENGMMYINRGLGSASWPIRIRSLPELSVFRLQAGTHMMLERTSSEEVTVSSKRTKQTA